MSSPHIKKTEASLAFGPKILPNIQILKNIVKGNRTQLQLQLPIKLQRFQEYKHQFD